jgi:hypothetical protein
VYQPHTATEVLRKIGLLALIGFGAITLSGPILAVLSVVLSLGTVVAGFALVGFLIWLPFRLVTGGAQSTMAAIQDANRDLGHIVRRAAGMLWALASFPFRLTGAILLGGIYVVARVLHVTAATVAIVGGISLAALTGAAAGVGMGILTATTPGEMEAAIPVNALAGGLIGAATGIIMTVRERRRPATLSAQAVA